MHIAVPVTVAALATLVLTMPPPASAATFRPTGEISGPAVVVDGDTIRVDGTTVRLKGVDAAETGTARGDAATNALIRMIGGRRVICDLTGETTRGREVGFCREDIVGPQRVDEEIGARLIAAGQALACPGYSTRYVALEQAAAREAQPRAAYCLGGARAATIEGSDETERFGGNVGADRLQPESGFRIPGSDEVVPARSRKRGVVCMYPDDLDRAGRRCGARAATVRSGGL